MNDDRSAATCVGTVAFTDLVGFTEYTDAVGDSGAVRVLDEQTRMVSDLLDVLCDARIVKELGDGLMLWFSSPADALGFSIDLMGSIDRARTNGSFPLAVRVGLHHGEAVARGDDLVGQTVNIAARVSDLAGPGEVLVSDEVMKAVADDMKMLAAHPIGPVSVKGVRQPIWLQRLTTRRQPASG